MSDLVREGVEREKRRELKRKLGNCNVARITSAETGQAPEKRTRAGGKGLPGRGSEVLVSKRERLSHDSKVGVHVAS